MTTLLNVLKKVNFWTTKYKNVFVFGMIFGIYYGMVLLLNAGTTCVLKNVTGIPCPSCGMTRSYTHLLHGEFNEAFIDHPLFWTIPLILILSWFLHQKKDSIALARLLSLSLMMILVAFIVVYIIRMILLFPGIEPLKFYENGLIPTIYRFAKNLFL